jgi:hypothetical protein
MSQGDRQTCASGERELVLNVSMNPMAYTRCV